MLCFSNEVGIVSVSIQDIATYGTWNHKRYPML
jgi:hypothetical protein